MLIEIDSLKISEWFHCSIAMIFLSFVPQMCPNQSMDWELAQPGNCGLRDRAQFDFDLYFKKAYGATLQLKSD